MKQGEEYRLKLEELIASGKIDAQQASRLWQAMMKQECPNRQFDSAMNSFEKRFKKEDRQKVTDDLKKSLAEINSNYGKIAEKFNGEEMRVLQNKIADYSRSISEQIRREIHEACRVADSEATRDQNRIRKETASENKPEENEFDCEKRCGSDFYDDVCGGEQTADGESANGCQATPSNQYIEKIVYDHKGKPFEKCRVFIKYYCGDLAFRGDFDTDANFDKVLRNFDNGSIAKVKSLVDNKFCGRYKYIGKDKMLKIFIE